MPKLDDMIAYDCATYRKRVAELERSIRWTLEVAAGAHPDPQLALSRIADEARASLQKPINN